MADLSLDGTVERAGFRVAAQLVVASGEVVGLLGPNGAGKTTLLRGLAGLDRLGQGSLRLGTRVLDDPAAGVFVPPHRRGMGVMFQDLRLFGHLTLLDNVAFGMRARGWTAAAAADVAREWLDKVQLSGAGGLRPGQVSGGQAARVALARALAPQPAALLLDEPLGAVDAEARQQMRQLVRTWVGAGGRPCVLVTHDPVEAAMLTDRVVVVEAGAMTQSGSMAEVTARPATPWVAGAVGLNLLTGTAHGRSLVVGKAVITLAEPAWGAVSAVVRPRSITLYRSPPESSARNVLSGEVRALEAAGERLRVTVAGAVTVVAEVTPEAAAALELAAGGRVWASFKTSELDVYPAGES